jgi:putative ABC transport system permease protein
MTLYKIALSNLRRRKSKMVFVILGLVIGIATVVSVYSMVESMKQEMTRQMSEFGANIVVTPDTGELVFSYGGITIPEVLFDVEKLMVSDLSAIETIPGRDMVRAVAPKLLGIASVGNRKVIISGSHLQSEFAIKPWLQLQLADVPVEGNTVGNEPGADMVMNEERLNLAREDLGALELAGDEILLGATVAENLGLLAGDLVAIDGREFQVFALLAENGSPEDDQVMMNLSVAQDVLKRPGELTVIEISADYSLGSENVLIAQLNSALPHTAVTSLRQAVLGRDEMLTRLTRFGTSISVLVLFIGTLVVALTMSGAVRERTREIGVFRAIGFRKSHVTRIILTEGALVSVIGGAIGYVVGMVAVRFAGSLLAGMDITLTWRIDLFVATQLLAIFIGALASLYPARQAAKLDPADALRFI